MYSSATVRSLEDICADMIMVNNLLCMFVSLGAMISEQILNICM